MEYLEGITLKHKIARTSHGNVETILFLAH